MTWLNLGTVAPNLEQWSFFDLEDTSGVLFRISQNNSVYVPKGYAWLSFAYLIDNQFSYHKFHRIFPDWKNPGPKLIISPIPPEFLSAGIAVRTPVAKLYYRSIWTDPTWQLTLEVWAGPAPDPEINLLEQIDDKIDILLEQGI